MISRHIYLLLAMVAAVASSPVPVSDAHDPSNERVSDNIGTVDEGLPFPSIDSEPSSGNSLREVPAEGFVLLARVGDGDPAEGHGEHVKRENATNLCILM